MTRTIKQLANKILENKFSPSIERYVAMAIANQEEVDKEHIAEIAAHIEDSEKLSADFRQLVSLLVP